ncbi:adenylate/guanylate cyclase domain-containing protein [uncultured Roseibium sp.]|uniref:adenylate/guanylate cyclase domain-containing protein n=1 Tax=uncultured Roseibium sp. TaxID=1936171 RepID=UPI00261CB3E9|nr:adenylate/guanylate cyclase domain-containing protein [uncultured Roseibium sp.]
MRIAWKIFGVSLIVFLIMAGAATFSIYKIFKINNELQLISQVYSPLRHEVARIEVIALQEELELERVEKLEAELRADRLEALSAGLTETDIDSAVAQRPDLQARIVHLEERLETGLALFETHANNVETLLRSAERRVRSAQDEATSLDDKLELAALYPTLIAIETQHSNFHSHALNLVKAADLPPATREDLEEQLESEGQKLTERLNALREHVSDFTDQSVATAALHEQQALYASIAATACAGLLALLLSSFVISGLLKPMRALSSGAKRVEEGDFEVRLTPRSRDEIGSLTNSFNTMVDGLRSTQKIKDTFGQYLDPRVVSGLIADQSHATAGTKKVVSAYFSDLADFTTISEQFTPGGLVRVLNRYLDLMSSQITDRQGVIDKYIGDAIMAYWAQPFSEDDDQATLAVESALANIRLMELFQQELPDLTGLQKNLPFLRQRIGIATGEAVIGSIGSEKTKNYTIMGDTVNLAARLEGANKVYGTQILVCQRTRDTTSGIEFRPVDKIQVKGKSEPTNVYTPLGSSQEMPQDLKELQERSEDALSAFSQARWADARQAFEAILVSNPGDQIAAVFLNRLDLISSQGAPADWDGVWHLNTK